MAQGPDLGSTQMMRSNQAKIDELEYFVEGIARSLFGPEAEDYRRLRDFVPTTPNLSLLIDAARARPPKDIAEDFRFVWNELEKHCGEAPADDYPEFNVEMGLFNVMPYLDLLARPSVMLDKIERRHHAEVLALGASSPRRLMGLVARINAYAWFELVGLPDLASEFAPASERRPLLEPDESRTVRGLETIYGLAQGVDEGLRAYLGKCHYLLHLGYRQDITQLLSG